MEELNIAGFSMMNNEFSYTDFRKHIQQYREERFVALFCHNHILYKTRTAKYLPN